MVKLEKRSSELKFIDEITNESIIALRCDGYISIVIQNKQGLYTSIDEDLSLVGRWTENTKKDYVYKFVGYDDEDTEVYLFESNKEMFSWIAKESK